MDDNPELTRAILRRFEQNSPLTVMMQHALSYTFAAAPLDALFEQHGEDQYVRTLTFSSVVNLLGEVVLRVQPSVRAAYLQRREQLGVTLQALYDKLTGTAPNLSAQLVKHIAQRAAKVLAEMGAPPHALPLPTRRLRVLDGNHLAATHRRPKKLRALSAGPRPGFGVVVYDPALDLPLALLPCEDAYVQERALADEVLAITARDECWIGDRNFCTTTLLFGWASRGAVFLVREHANAPVEVTGARRHVGSIEAGKVFEQTAIVRLAGVDPLQVRRIVVVLDKPTRDGDQELVLLSTVPAEEADALTLATLYSKRWKIETAFQRLATLFNNEIKTLAYPRAALFGFAVGLVAYALVALLEGALRAVHGAQVSEQLSWYLMVHDIQSTQEGMRRAVPEEAWSATRAMSVTQMAGCLLALARNVSLASYPKARRKNPSKPAAKRTRFKNRPHVSTFRILNDIPQKLS
jgi:IS4 transposase